MAIVNQHPAFKAMSAEVRTIVVTDSSFLQLFKYDASQMSLTVVFKNGAEYVHQSVSPSMVDGLEDAENMGSFYATKIKGKTPSSKVINKNVGPRGGLTHGRNTGSAGANARGKGPTKSGRGNHGR